MQRGHLDSLRVLVTGATGFIGSNLCRHLVAAGAEVVGVARRGGRAHDGGRVQRADLSDLDTTKRVFDLARPDIVFHLASHVSGSRDIEVVAPTLHNNLITTVNVLTAASATGGPRVLVAGSAEESPAGNTDAAPGSPYAAAKTANVAYERMFHELYGVDVVNLRTFMVYGPGQSDHTKLVPYVTESLLRGVSPRVTTGARPVDWIYIDDVVEAYLTAAITPGLAGRSVAIGSGVLVTIREVVELLVELTHSSVQPRFGALPGRPLEHARRADVGATQEAIGWKPTVPLRVGLERTVQWLECRISR